MFVQATKKCLALLWGGEVMASALRWNTTLKKLCLQGNSFHDAGYEVLSAFMTLSWADLTAKGRLAM